MHIFGTLFIWFAVVSYYNVAVLGLLHISSKSTDVYTQHHILSENPPFTIYLFFELLHYSNSTDVDVLVTAKTMDMKMTRRALQKMTMESFKQT